MIEYFDERDWKKVDATIRSTLEFVQVRVVGDCDETKFNNFVDNLKKEGHNILLGLDCPFGVLYAQKGGVAA